MTREEARQAVRDIASRPELRSDEAAVGASLELIELVPEDALALIGRPAPRVGVLGHIGTTFDGPGIYLSWFVPGRQLSFEYLRATSFYVHAEGRDAALDGEVEWRGLPVGVVDLSRPEAAAVVASIFEHLNPAREG